jgi:thiol-disulfide isomerase/thioredoxin
MTPPPAGVHVRLARLEAARGNDAKALDMFIVAAAAASLNAADTATMRALHTKVRGGTDAALEDLIDKAYLEKFPNPVKRTEYTPLPNRSDRLVLLEMFTGSGCGPCVAADLAFDAVMAHYPAGTIVPISFHENIPLPDPMVTAGTNERINYYGRRAVPTFTIDGGPGRVGGGGRTNAEATYKDYITKIDKALQVPATAALSVSATGTADEINVTADVTRLPAGAKDLRLHILIVEKHLRFLGENGIRFHPMVVRASAGPNGTGIPISAPGRTEQTFSLTSIKEDISTTLKNEIEKRRTSIAPGAATREFAADGRAYVAIDTGDLAVVAFVQQGAYQATATGPVAGVEGDENTRVSNPATPPKPVAPGGPLINVLQAAIADVKFSGATKGPGR